MCGSNKLQVIQVKCHWVRLIQQHASLCRRAAHAFRPRSNCKPYWIPSALLCGKFIVSIIQLQQQQKKWYIQYIYIYCFFYTHAISCEIVCLVLLYILWRTHTHTYRHAHNQCRPWLKTELSSCPRSVLTALTLTFMGWREQPIYTHTNTRTEAPSGSPGHSQCDCEFVCPQGWRLCLWHTAYTQFACNK